MSTPQADEWAYSVYANTFDDLLENFLHLGMKEGFLNNEQESRIQEVFYRARLENAERFEFTDRPFDIWLDGVKKTYTEDMKRELRQLFPESNPTITFHENHAKHKVEDLPLGGKLIVDEEVQTMRNERRTVSETGGEKGVKFERFDLIPVRPLESLAQRYGYGAEKYAERNWERGYEWSKSYAACQRHLNAFWRGEDEDDEMPGGHLAAAAFHIFAMMEFMVTHPEFDDRPKEN